MEKYLRPSELSLDPNTPNCGDEWMRWKDNFTNFLSAIPEAQNPSGANNLKLLKAHVACPAYNLIKDCASYKDAIKLLDERYIRPVNIIYARHLLASRKQKPSESVKSYVEDLEIWPAIVNLML